MVTEHLQGGSASNPDHAVEMHPLTAIANGSANTDFTDNIFAGAYGGGVGEATAFSILDTATVDVTRSGAVPVRLVSIKGTAMNDAIGKLRPRTRVTATRSRFKRRFS
jgi:hypothetical protein